MLASLALLVQFACMFSISIMLFVEINPKHKQVTEL